MDYAFQSEFRVTVQLDIPWRDKALTGRLWSTKIVDGTTADSLMKDFGLHYDMLVAVPREKQQNAQDFFADHAIAEHLSYMEMAPRDTGDGFGRTPLATIVPIFESLARGKDVLLLRWTDAPSGFVPAILSILSASYVHIEKVIYPVRQSGYELSSEQIAYLYGQYDAFNSPVRSVTAFPE